ncbi:MAG: flagellar basal body-associated FliL family protein [Alphaproteobacteria bacterium]|nr:flagellar basal body-associated FliL family protein [Alphaproteobacteria bacterium]
MRIITDGGRSKDFVNHRPLKFAASRPSAALLLPHGWTTSMTDQAIEPDDQIDDEEDEAVAEEQDATGSKRIPGKKLILFVVLPLILVIGLGAGAYFMGYLDALMGKETDPVAAEKQKLEKQRATAVFFDLPELLVNLNSPGRRTNFLKISISLELPAEADIKQLEILMPRIVDSFQVYLRELRVEDLRGSAGIYRLREDLLRRVNEAAKPVKVNDILFKEVLVQ